MARDSRIKDNKKGEFRPYLCVEDVKLGATDKFVQVTDPYGNAETVIVATEQPFRVPLMSYMFYVKVASAQDKYITRAINDLKYLNPTLDDLGWKKLTEYLVRQMSAKGTGGALKITYEQMAQTVRNHKYTPCTSEANADKVLLFQRKSLIPKSEKTGMTMQTRQLRSKYLHGEIIHNAALFLIEVQKDLAIKKVQVHKEVQQEKGLKSYRSFNKYIEQKTVDILEEVAKYRKFYTQEELEQFEDYMIFREKGKSTAEMVQLLGVSYSTLSKYSSIYKDLKVKNMI